MRAPRRLLVTGAGGFLGAHLVDAGRRGGWEVVAHVRTAGSAEGRLGDARRAPLDLAGESGLESWLESIAPDCVIHAAALSRIADCDRDPELARRVNVDAARELARACAARGTRCVHVSTDLVFGALAAPAGGFDEQGLPAPISLYGSTKLEAERAVQAVDAGALVVRLPLLVGPSHGRGLGASDAVLAAVERGERPSLFDDEWRTPLDVRSAAEALLELAQEHRAGILHVAGPERMSRYELGLRALRRAGLRADQARAAISRTTRAGLGLAATRPADVSLDASRARKLLRTVLVGLDGGSS